MYTLDILISCCNDSVDQIPALLPAPAAGVRFIVVHQQFHSQGNAEQIAALQTRSDVLYVASTSKGLSVSRNLALSHATADLVLFSDDDVAFLPDAFSQIRAAFGQMPTADVLTFRYCVTPGVYRKQYPDKITRRSHFSIFRVSSIEVVARRESLLKKHITFDERFGLGTALPVSEENIFLADCLTSGLQVWFYPATLVAHPEQTSGANWNSERSFARGALFKRVFGRAGLPILLLFMFKHSRKFGTISRFFTALRTACSGFVGFNGKKS
ncbi:glycosyltransferase family 2 protein [Alishewanella longhuensis]